MPYLHNIVTYLNEQIRTVSLPAAIYQQGNYYGVAVSLPRNSDETDYVPCIVTNDDNEVWVGTDDTAPITIYHKNAGISTITDPKNNFGKGNVMVETATFYMVVYGDRRRLQVTPEDLYAYIISGWTHTLPKTFTEPLQLRGVTISQVTPNFDSIAVYQREYKTSKYPLKPNDIFFSIQYKVETRYNKECVLLCDPLTT